MHWQTARYRIDLREPKVMGIVNVTPDSFSDGGLHVDAKSAIAHCHRLVDEGADFLDIGGESTRPGSRSPSQEEELARLRPVVAAAIKMGVPISVDTSRADVISEMLDLGADIVNDVRAFRLPGARQAVAGHPTAGVVLMHMQGEPATMQNAPSYGDVVEEVATFLRGQLDAAIAAGIAVDRIVLDPGYGFGKSLEHNLELARRQSELLQMGRPLLAGWSRKGTLGRLTGRQAHERLPASVAAALAAVAQGARIVRVHDVAQTVDALKVWAALTPPAAV